MYKTFIKGRLEGGIKEKNTLNKIKQKSQGCKEFFLRKLGSRWE